MAKVYEFVVGKMTKRGKRVTEDFVTISFHHSTDKKPLTDLNVERMMQNSLHSLTNNYCISRREWERERQRECEEIGYENGANQIKVPGKVFHNKRPQDVDAEPIADDEVEYRRDDGTKVIEPKKDSPYAEKPERIVEMLVRNINSEENPLNRKHNRFNGKWVQGAKKMAAEEERGIKEAQNKVDVEFANLNQKKEELAKFTTDTIKDVLGADVVIEETPNQEQDDEAR